MKGYLVMSVTEISTIFSEAETALKEAGKLLISPKISKNEIVEKGFANYVTQIDYQVQSLLAMELERIIPGCNVITEEYSANKYDLDKPTWILDPVDGTTNLLHGYRHSSISLALFRGGRPALGFIYNPVAGEMFVGKAGSGAFLNGRKINASSNRHLGDCLIGFGTTPYDREKADRSFQIVRNIYRECQDIRRSGSAALDLAYVACGRTDGFFELCLQPWDFAAGMLILEEAGGKVTNLEGKRPEVISQSEIIATNGLIHEALLKIF